ncbi:hypothetical protein C8258_21175 [Nocardia sp. MDA0666]|nr:hypothetical protein C8258_21175 [Nocardia sp. MDA0666]
MAVLITPGQAADSGDVARSARAGGGAPARRRPTSAQPGHGHRGQGVLGSFEPGPAAAQTDPQRHTPPIRPGRQPEKRGRLGGRPPGFDKVEYKRRNAVERAFNKAEHWRGVATHYDKLALTYRAGFTLALIVEWLESSGDTT